MLTKKFLTYLPLCIFLFAHHVASKAVGTPLQASALQVESEASNVDSIDANSLVGKWGAVFTSHMLTVEWDEKTGWHSPKIEKFGNLSLSPAASVFHYGLEAFEGLKAYKDAQGRVRLFRPEMNLKRLNSSLGRIAFPLMDEVELMSLLKTFVRHQKAFIPDKDGYSLYLRPTAISTHPSLGVAPSKSVKFYIIACPVGPYYPTGFKPVKLLADTKNIRAWPGGTGIYKLGSNYAPTIKPAMDAQASSGCSQILWLWGENRAIRECGAMNIFFLFRKDDGSLELATPSLDAGDILPGVTRRSVIEIVREWDGFEVREREITIEEVLQASRDGRLVECFSTGTAAVISPIKGIQCDGEDIVIPTGEDIGPIANRVWTTLNDIQYGRVEHEWSVLCDDE